MKRQPIFICQRCGHELVMPRAGMTLREAKSWFKYAHCPVCKRTLRVIERVPAPVVAAYTQQQLWSEEPVAWCPPENTVQRSRGAGTVSAAPGTDCHATT